MKWIWLLFVGCSTQSRGELNASDISYNGQNIAIALADLEGRMVVQAQQKYTGEPNKELISDVEQLRKDLSILQDELAHIRTLLETVQEGGIAHAKLIPFDPRVTTLKAQTLQEAMDEMMARVNILERNVLDDLGEPGPGLFEIPKDKKKGNNNGPQGQPQGGNPGGQPGGQGPPGGQGQSGGQGQIGPKGPPP